MCGVTGYVGKKNGKQSILDALSKLQYRGHDGAGFACLTDDNKISVIKEHGTVELLKKKMQTYTDDGLVALGHVRWARCGAQSALVNAHPHINETETIVFGHTGYISNYKQLRHDLIKKGYHFSSQTDTEVVPHLLDECLSSHDNIESALKKMVRKLQGSFALIGLTQSNPDVLISIRKRSPLAVLIDDNGVQISSDFRAIGGTSNKGFFHPDETFGVASADGVQLYSFDGSSVPVVMRDIAVAQPVYQSNLLNNVFNSFEAHLRSLLNHIFPDRIMPKAEDELFALVNSMLSGPDLNPDEKGHISKIMRAFDHLEDGTYGLCFACGHPLSEQVLAMHPHMSLCKKCHGNYQACA